MKFVIVIIVVIPMIGVAIQHMGKYATDVVGRTILGKNADKAQAGLVDVRVGTPDLTRKNVCTDAMYMK